MKGETSCSDMLLKDGPTVFSYWLYFEKMGNIFFVYFVEVTTDHAPKRDTIIGLKIPTIS